MIRPGRPEAVCEVACPLCHEPVEVIQIRNSTVMRLKEHHKIYKTWSKEHLNGFKSALDIRVRCSASLARVKIVEGLDRRHARSKKENNAET